MVFALKAGLGLGGALAGLVLSGFGYVSNATEAQSWMAVQGIRWVGSIIPAVLFAVGVAALWFYPITKGYNETMQHELQTRRKKNA